MKIKFKIILMLISITFGCHAKPKADTFEYESLMIQALKPAITILADGNKDGLNLKENFPYKYLVKTTFI